MGRPVGVEEAGPLPPVQGERSSRSSTSRAGVVAHPLRRRRLRGRRQPGRDQPAGPRPREPRPRPSSRHPRRGGRGHRARRGLRPPLRHRGDPARRAALARRAASSSTASAGTARSRAGPRPSSRTAAVSPPSGSCPTSASSALDAEDSLGPRRGSPGRHRPGQPGSTWRPSGCPASPTSPISTRSSAEPGVPCPLGRPRAARSGTPTSSSSAGTRATVADLRWLRDSGLAGGARRPYGLPQRHP